MMVWRATDPQGNESKKIVWEVAPYLRGRGIDVGAGDFKILPHAISVDNMNHQRFGYNVRPDIFSEADNLEIIASATMDFVYSSHTLEHVVDPKKALKEWWRVLRQGGYLVLYLPHKNFYPNIGVECANPDHKHDFLPDDIIALMPSGWTLLENQERNDDMEYSFLQVYKKRSDGKNVRADAPYDLSKRACVVRYGAFGDVMQASSIFKGLKDQGYHVTVFASPPGSDVVRHDPNIDNLVLFDKDQIPNQNLGDFWKWHSKKYERWVNLSESVEATLLALPGRMPHLWPPEVRHKMMNVNYLEFQHSIAQVPHKPQIRFYPTVEETLWADKQLRAWNNPEMLVVYSLSGSSVHKTWQGLDNIVASIMVSFPHAHVVLMGGPECVILEAGWEKEPRVHLVSGKWSMRQSLTIARRADMVIGPETGVLNAVSCEPMAKVVFLSHSSHENLTRDWTNVYPIYSVDSTCARRRGVPACHTLHYGWEYCSRNEETGTALCQSEIDPQQVWDVVFTVLNQAREKAA